MKGSVKLMKSGSYRLVYDGPPDSEGHRKQIAETVKCGSKEAWRILRERVTAIETGTYVPKKKETVAQFMQAWLDTYCASNVTLRTQQSYQANIQRYINPAIGGLALQNLGPRHIQGLYGDMLAKGLSPRTVLHAHRCLREALQHGVKWGILIRNPADATSPPHPKAERLAMWDSSQIRRFLETARNSPMRDAFELTILTGMRRSEIAGLKWDSVDLTGGRVAVVETLQRIRGKGLMIGQPKTNKSRRSIALSPVAVGLLRRVQGSQLLARANAGDAWEQTNYVFTQADGRSLNPDKLTTEFHRLVKTSGLPVLTFHGLRHAHATLLLSAGVHAKVVSERLGHSNVGITLDVYSHVLPNIQEDAARAIDAQLQNP